MTRAGFLMVLAALAAGGAIGYVAGSSASLTVVRGRSRVKVTVDLSAAEPGGTLSPSSR